MTSTVTASRSWATLTVTVAGVRGVAGDVGQRLLYDPVDGAGHFGRPPRVRRRASADARRAVAVEPFDQLAELLGAGHGGGRRRRRRAAGRPRGASRPARRSRRPRCPAREPSAVSRLLAGQELGGLGLEHDAGDVVGDDVVQFPGQLQALVAAYPLGDGPAPGGRAAAAPARCERGQPRRAVQHRHRRSRRRDERGQQPTGDHHDPAGRDGAGRPGRQRSDRRADQHRQAQRHSGPRLTGQTGQPGGHDGGRRDGQARDGRPRPAAPAYQSQPAHDGPRRRSRTASRRRPSCQRSGTPGRRAPPRTRHRVRHRPRTRPTRDDSHRSG